VTTGFHRNLSLLAVFFLGIHIVTAVVDPYTSLGWTTALIPFASNYRTLWLGLGTVAFDLLLAILLTSLLRGYLGHRAWRAVHWLAYASWPVAVVHGFGTGTDSWSAWLLILNAVCILAVGWAVAVRLLLPAGDPLAAERAHFRESARSRSAGR
jgi:predicted ferric reductase